MTNNPKRFRGQELCEGRGGRPGLLIRSNTPHGLCGRKATLEATLEEDLGSELRAV